MLALPPFVFEGEISVATLAVALPANLFLAAVLLSFVAALHCVSFRHPYSISDLEIVKVLRKKIFQQINLFIGTNLRSSSKVIGL